MLKPVIRSEPNKHGASGNTHPAPLNGPMERLKQLTVLVVISSDKTATLIEKIFRQLGFESVQVAQDAATGVYMLREMSIGLMVTDSQLTVTNRSRVQPTKFVLPSTTDMELNGLHFIHRLRNAPNSPAHYMPIMILMDQSRQSEIEHARDVGVNEVVTKPMNVRNFCDHLIQLVDKPRDFVTAPTYKGPCRRRAEAPSPPPLERRLRDIRVIRCQEPKVFTHARIPG